MKFTPWFSYLTPPVRFGVYQRLIEGKIYYSYWNGEFFSLSVDNVDLAFQLQERRSFYYRCDWRGLAKKQ